MVTVNNLAYFIRIHKNVLDLKDFLFNQIEGFLQDTIRLVLKSDSMEQFDKINGNFTKNELDPLSNELDYLRTKKEYAEGVEQLYTGVRDVYQNAKISDLKNL